MILGIVDVAGLGAAIPNHLVSQLVAFEEIDTDIGACDERSDFHASWSDAVRRDQPVMESS
jgi:hypothetical protein